MSTIGIVLYQVTDEVLADLRQEAMLATGKKKYDLYAKLRIFSINKGRWLVKSSPAEPADPD
jgi:hypothetical protein